MCKILSQVFVRKCSDSNTNPFNVTTSLIHKKVLKSSHWVGLRLNICCSINIICDRCAARVAKSVFQIGQLGKAYRDAPTFLPKFCPQFLLQLFQGLVLFMIFYWFRWLTTFLLFPMTWAHYFGNIVYCSFHFIYLLNAFLGYVWHMFSKVRYQ